MKIVGKVVPSPIVWFIRLIALALIAWLLYLLISWFISRFFSGDDVKTDKVVHKTDQQKTVVTEKHTRLMPPKNIVVPPATSSSPITESKIVYLPAPAGDTVISKSTLAALLLSKKLVIQKSQPKVRSKGNGRKPSTNGNPDGRW